MAQAPKTPQTQQRPNPQQAEHDARPLHPSGEVHPDAPSVSQAQANDEAAQKAADEAEDKANKDFKLAKTGSRDYVAGQPVDDKELADTIKESKDRKETAREAAKEAHTPERTHAAWTEQYGGGGKAPK